MLPAETYDILALLGIAVLVWFIWESLRAREAAVRASRAACDAEGLQFLDDTVAIEAVRLARDDNGRLTLRRVYGFEYSDTGNSRHKAGIVMDGAEVVMLRLGKHASDRPLKPL